MSSSNSKIFDLYHPLLQEHEGLTMSEAFDSLHSEIVQFKNDLCNKDFRRRIFVSSFHHDSYYSTFSWIPVGVVTIIALALLIFTTFSYHGILIMALTLLDIFVVYWYNYLRLSEFRHRLSYVLKMLKKTRKNNDWCPDQFPNLFTPNSPAVSLQWTIRDGRILNLPTSLLAKGDVIILRPGQLAPAHVKTCYPAPSVNDKYNVLLADQLFGQEPTAVAGEIIHFDAHRSVDQPSVNDRLYTVLQAPYVAQLNSLSEDYFERPVSLYDKARYLLFGKSLHHTMLPFFFIFFEILAAIRWYVSSFPPRENDDELERWIYFFIIETSSLIVPLISLVFPVFWFISNAFGNALLLARYSFPTNEACDQTKENESKFESAHFGDVEGSSKSSTSDPLNKPRRRHHLYRLVLNFAQNNISAMIRYTNFLHTMASVTVLCCVDKKGVLSFPNPIAEKVFFLKNSYRSSDQRNDEIDWDGRRVVASSTEDSKITGNLRKLAEECPNDKSSKRISPSVEILDITPRDEKGSAWKIEFDDCQWRSHLASLKALGLAILVNTCNKKTHETYNNFYSFITAHAVQHKHLVPVANRRCLCELARQIGFHEKYIENKYGLELQIFTYKNLAETQTGNKYVKAIFKTRKPKFPFPHAMSVIVSNDNIRNDFHRSCCSKKENFDDGKKRKQSINTCEERQMFSQGTADIILDYCVDYWDGFDVHPLTPTIRKKILDFYQRCSLTAYCTAFSYRPVHKNILCKTNSHNSNSVMYLEFLNNVDSERGHLRQKRRYRRTREFRKCDRDLDLFCGLPDFKSHLKNERETIPLQKLAECDEDIDESFDDNIEDYDDNISYSIADCNDEFQLENYSEESNEDDDNCYSVDLSYENEPVFNRKPRLSSETTSHVKQSRYVQLLNKQIFLGMVSMQYQPLVDMVQLIEELEKACIRFVHFSKENELRSRVFSEKMGLESGWNCHISLLPDADSKSLAESFGTEGITLLADHEMSSTIDTGASSADDEENVPFSFDLSNRAKLPCGIMNIKPHLEQVDNVPLLVSLFTDCTSETTEQMLSIMQEYGQIVCVMGSSANIKNFILFARADSSISVEPLYAQVCQQIPSSLMNDIGQKSCLSPTELSHVLNSLPCSLILQRNYNYHRILPVYPLIAESRNLMRSVWNCVQFWLCCITLTFAVQLLSILLLLPAIFTLEQALWISIIVIPCLSVSLITSAYDECIMTKAKGKDWLCSISWPTIKYALTCYGSKLICGIVAVFVSYFIELVYVCDCLNTFDSDTASFFNNTQEPVVRKKNCIYTYFLNSSENDFMETPYLRSLNAIQFHMALILTLNLVALCTSFLHRDSVFWRKVPKFNFVWMLLVFIPLSLQVCHYIRTINNSSSECLLINISLLSVRNAFFTFLSPCLSYFISEIIKIHEIRINERYQKKVRLEFGTKLGMNSPF